MHRIDGPGATVDNKFTDGDPVGGVPATLVTDDWLNDVQEEVLSVLASASVAPVKGVQNQLLVAIMTLIKRSDPVVGSVRGGKATLFTASASIFYSATEVVVSTSLGGTSYRLAGVSSGLNVGSVGAGGMDTGPAPVNGWVAVYVIYNPVSGAIQLLGRNATSAIQTDVYGGANMPAGYTASALIAVLPTNASGQFKPFTLKDRTVYQSLVTVLSSTVNVSLAALSIATAVPPNAIEVFGEMEASSSSASNVSISVAGDGFHGAQNVSSSLAAGGNLLGNFANVPIVTPQTINASALTSGAGPTFKIHISGYKI